MRGELGSKGTTSRTESVSRPADARATSTHGARAKASLPVRDSAQDLAPGVRRDSAAAGVRALPPSVEACHALHRDRTMSSKGRTRTGLRTLLLVLLLPGLLVAQVAGGQDLLLHEHDSTPLHVHLVPHDAAAHGHVHESDHGDDSRPHDHDGDPIEGIGGRTCEFRLSSTGPLFPGSSRHLDLGRSILARRVIETVEPWRPRYRERIPARDRGSSEVPPRHRGRSVLVSLLSSSRAILI